MARAETGPHTRRERRCQRARDRLRGAWVNLNHLADGVEIGGADAVLAATCFHYGEFTNGRAKQHLAERRIPVPVMLICSLFDSC